MIATGYQAMTPYADPLSDEVDIYGKGNSDDDLLRDFGKDGRDNAYVELGPNANTKSSPLNNNMKKRKREGKADEQIGIADKVQYSLNHIFDRVTFMTKKIQKMKMKIDFLNNL